MSKPTAWASTLSAVQATRLIKRLCAQGCLSDARKVFDVMHHRDVVGWTAMISGYASNGWCQDAWVMFRRMLCAGVLPNEFTLSTVLTTCRGPEQLMRCRATHAAAVRWGIDTAPYVENALLDAYASSNEGMIPACALFGMMNEQNTVSCTTMIAAYARQGQECKGLKLFQRIVQNGAELSPFTLSIVIHACASIAYLTLGRQLHALSIKFAFHANLPVANSIVDMYCKSMNLVEAKRYFSEMPQTDLITWNTMIAGLDCYRSHEALWLFLEMRLLEVEPNCFTFTTVLSACANLATLRCGQQVHGAVVRKGFRDIQICNVLIDMYAKSGSIVESKRVFDEMPCKDIVSWTSILIGCGMNGYGHVAIQLFDEMILANILPDHVVFLGLISACNHAGLLEEGWKYFKLMSTVYEVKPNKEIYGCVVDLLGRAGRLAEAFELIQTMPFEPDESTWGALLGACKLHKNSELGRLAAENIAELKPGVVKIYVLLSNIYAADSEWHKFAATRKLVRGMGIKKETGTSWVEIRGEVCSFVSGDSSNCYVVLAIEALEILAQHVNEPGNQFDFYEDLVAAT